MDVEVVIGANYGDEGKGMMTEYLCRNSKNPIVILNNGGSQRGHTVSHPKYGKHVFRHFGSGTLDGVPTYLTGSFIVNPMQFVKEWNEITALTGKEPVVYMSSGCRWQIPSDIALNWHLEKVRGENRHGSCGCGIWETVRRCSSQISAEIPNIESFNRETHQYKINWLKNISLKQIKEVCDSEGLASNKVDIADLFLSDGFLQHYLFDLDFMLKKCRIRPFYRVLFDSLGYGYYDTLVFENGQGLKLDQWYEAANGKHTTPSYTGSIGAARFLDGIRDVNNVRLNYVSRTYLTRHGNGNFREEPGMKFDDSTNVWNEWQESMRFAELDYAELLRRISIDVSMFKKFSGLGHKTTHRILFTHCNEVELKSKDQFQVPLLASSSIYANDIIAIER